VKHPNSEHLTWAVPGFARGLGADGSRCLIFHGYFGYGKDWERLGKIGKVESNCTE